MKNKIIEYGTQHKCKVLSVTENLIVVLGEDGEGYVLIGHGIKDLPKEGDKGKITFVKNENSLQGYWNYEQI